MEDDFFRRVIAATENRIQYLKDSQRQAAKIVNLTSETHTERRERILKDLEGIMDTGLDTISFKAREFSRFSHSIEDLKPSDARHVNFYRAAARCIEDYWMGHSADGLSEVREAFVESIEIPPELNQNMSSNSTALSELTERISQLYATRTSNIEKRLEDKMLIFLYMTTIESAYESVSQGDAVKAAENIMKIAEFDKSSPAKYFIASCVQAFAEREPELSDAAEKAWKAVSKDIDTYRPDKPYEKLIEGSYGLRNVAGYGFTKVHKGTAIVREYDSRHRQAALEEVARYRKIVKALGSEVERPRELACYEAGGNIIHVERRIPGKTLEQHFRENSPDPFTIIKAINSYLEFSEHVTHAYMNTPGNVFPVTDLDYEVEEKTLQRFAKVAGCCDFAVNTLAYIDAMEQVTKLLRKEKSSGVHNDLRAANIIMTSSDSFAFIDYDKVGYGKPLLDIVGLIEHTDVECSWIPLKESVYSNLILNGWKDNNTREEREILIHSAALLKVPRLCASVIKHHTDVDSWEGRGKYVVLKYLHAAEGHAARIANTTDTGLAQAATAMEEIFHAYFNAIITSTYRQKT